MRTSVQTTVIRDREGYVVHDYGNPAPDPSLSLLGQPSSGVYILGKSGANEKVTISVSQNLRLWEKARRINSPDEAVTFMNQWGQISRWLADDGSKPYNEAYLFIEDHLQGIKRLAEFVEAGDKQGFSLVLKGNRLLDRANITIDVSQPGAPLLLEAPSLLRFMMVEMWSEFGG